MGCCGNKKNKNDKLLTFTDTCYQADVDAMKRLGTKKNVNTRDEVFENTAVFHVTQHGTPECIDVLVELEADFTARNKVRI